MHHHGQGTNHPAQDPWHCERSRPSVGFQRYPGIIEPALPAAKDDGLCFFGPGRRRHSAVVEPETRAIRDENVREKINGHPAPLLLLINKVDQTDQNKLEALHAHWQSVHPRAECPISALHEFQTDYLLQRLIELLPEGPAYFDGETLTDRNERFFTSEIIGENILQLYEQEVPYSCEVEIESFVEGKNGTRSGQWSM